MDTIKMKYVNATSTSKLGIGAAIEDDTVYMYFIKNVDPYINIPEHNIVKIDSGKMHTKVKISINAAIVLYHLLEGMINTEDLTKNYTEIKNLNTKH